MASPRKTTSTKRGNRDAKLARNRAKASRRKLTKLRKGDNIIWVQKTK